MSEFQTCKIFLNLFWNSPQVAFSVDIGGFLYEPCTIDRDSISIDSYCLLSMYSLTVINHINLVLICMLYLWVCNVPMSNLSYTGYFLSPYPTLVSQTLKIQKKVRHWTHWSDFDVIFFSQKKKKSFVVLRFSIFSAVFEKQIVSGVNWNLRITLYKDCYSLRMVDSLKWLMLP